jgi:phthiocerol/phenolphthiocerol synthesis type-I polyketide synthase E
VEIGPGSTLCGLGAQNPAARRDSVFIPALRPAARNIDDRRFLMESLAQLWVQGAGVDWVRYYAHEERGRVPLPTYAFSHQSYWVHASAPPTVADGGSRQPLPTQVPSTLDNPAAAQPLPELHGRPKLTAPYRKPKTAVESELVGILETLLSIRPIGVDDNFFELGGHSLLATQVLSRINESFHVQLPFEGIFREPTVAGLAGLIESAGHTGADRHNPLEDLLGQIAAMGEEEIACQLETDKVKKSGGGG